MMKLVITSVVKNAYYSCKFSSQNTHNSYLKNKNKTLPQNNCNKAKATRYRKKCSKTLWINVILKILIYSEQNIQLEYNLWLYTTCSNIQLL